MRRGHRVQALTLHRASDRVQTLLRRWTDEADVLKRRGDPRAALLLEQCASEAQRAAEEFTTWLDESDAAARAGWTIERVRRHARLFVVSGYAVYERPRFRLLAAIVPHAPMAMTTRTRAATG